MKFRECLKKARENAGLTQRQLAEKLNVPASMIGRYESSDTETKVYLLQRICDVLNITPNQLLNYESNNKEYFFSLLRQCNISVQAGEFLEQTLKAAVTGKGELIQGYIFTHIPTGVTLHIEESNIQSFIEKILNDAREKNKSSFSQALTSAMNFEFFSAYAYSISEALEATQQELQEIQESKDISKLQQTQERLRYIIALDKKIRSDEAFREKLGIIYD